MTTVKERKVIQEQFIERMNEDELLNCIRCGFCLPACPTYKMSGDKESQSPRGRIAMMQSRKNELNKLPLSHRAGEFAVL